MSDTLKVDWKEIYNASKPFAALVLSEMKKDRVKAGNLLRRIVEEELPECLQRSTINFCDYLLKSDMIRFLQKEDVADEDPSVIPVTGQGRISLLQESVAATRALEKLINNAATDAETV